MCMRQHPTSVLLLLFLSAHAVFGQMLYVGNAGDGTISQYVFDQESGFLTELSPRVPDAGSPSSVTAHPSGKFVYVTNFGSGQTGPSLRSFSVNANTGVLTPFANLLLPN